MKLNKKSGATIMFTIEECQNQPVADEIAEFAADGVIKLCINPSMGTRSLTVIKMRETPIKTLHPCSIEITPTGLKLH